MDDNKKVSRSTGRVSEVIDLVNDTDEDDDGDDDDLSTTDCGDNNNNKKKKSQRSEPPPSKRSRPTNNDDKDDEEDPGINRKEDRYHPQAGAVVVESDVSSSISCPIKLFATYQDEQTRIQQAQSSPSHWSFLHCWTLRELLGLDQNPNDLRHETEQIDFLILSNFMIDLEYFFQEEAPELLSIPTIVVFYHHLVGDEDPTQPGKTAADLWKQRSGQQNIHFVHRDPNERSDAISSPIQFGCHHTKLFLVGYQSIHQHRPSRRLRVIVHTCNLLHNDIHLKCQGGYMEDFYWKENPFSSSPFETALTDYLATYKYKGKHKWCTTPVSVDRKEPVDEDTEASFLLDQIGNYDFSTAKAVLIPSVPGFHKVSHGDGPSWGYMAVTKAIQTHLPSYPSPRGRSIVCQFSSIGSLSLPYLQSLWNAWDINRVVKTSTGSRTLQAQRSHQFQLVYPTQHEIAASVEGLRGGGSVPGSMRNISKACLQNLWHRWTSPRASLLDKGQNVPHIKTYYQVDEDEIGMHWFMIGSHNFSKAAWGEQQNGIRGPCFKIFHWELGVFLSPQTVGVDRLIPLGGEKKSSTTTEERDERNFTTCEIPLPYAFRPDRHDLNDRPWTTDMMMMMMVNEGR